jgi:ABC-type multidrug transport system fused ATPase/permease subunit
MCRIGSEVVFASVSDDLKDNLTTSPIILETLLTLSTATGEGHLRAAWRILLAIGALPPFILFFLRLKLREPEPYQKEKMLFRNTPWWLVIKFYWWRLLIVSIIWFIYDLCSYSFGIFSGPLVDSLFSSSGGNTESLWQSLGWSTLLNFFYLPGAILGSFMADWIGAKYTLIIGTALQAVVGFALAAQAPWFFQSAHVAGFCIVYGLFLGFGELGPGDNIGLLASKTSATAVR